MRVRNSLSLHFYELLIWYQCSCNKYVLIFQAYSLIHHLIATIPTVLVTVRLRNQTKCNIENFDVLHAHVRTAHNTQIHINTRKYTHTHTHKYHTIGNFQSQNLVNLFPKFPSKSFYHLATSGMKVLIYMFIQLIIHLLFPIIIICNFKFIKINLYQFYIYSGMTVNYISYHIVGIGF